MTKSKKRQDILDAALRLFASHDIDSTTMEMIAREAHTGMGTIYNYFPSREYLINQLYRDVLGQMAQVLNANYSDQVPVREQFFTLQRNKLRFYLTDFETAAFVEKIGYSPIITQETQALAWEIWRLPVGMFEQGKRQQIIKDLPLELLLVLSSSPITGLIRRQHEGQVQLDDALIEAFITACWDAIKL